MPFSLCGAMLRAQAKTFKLEKRSISGGFCDYRETHRGSLSPIFQPRGRGSFQQDLLYQSHLRDVKLAFSALFACFTR